VATAGNGEEALSRIEEEEFDVIVTDIVMPGLGGLDVLEKSRLLGPQSAVILMTGHPSLDTAIAALRRGACDYIEKPFHLDGLMLRVRHLLGHREMVWRRARMISAGRSGSSSASTSRTSSPRRTWTSARRRACSGSAWLPSTASSAPGPMGRHLPDAGSM
jgi:DNA-binding NtrC family response regulator